MSERLTAIFDVGGVLRPVKKAGRPAAEATRNYAVMHALYRVLCHNPHWRVCVVTGRPNGVTPGDVLAELAAMGLPRPDECLVTSNDGDKTAAYRRLGADLVIDDSSFRCEAGRRLGALALQPK